MAFRPTERYGGMNVKLGEPPTEEHRDVIFIPNTPENGRAWGIFDQHGRLVPATAFVRGPDRLAVMQVPMTGLDCSKVTECAPDEVYIYGGAMHVHFGHFLLSTLSRFWLLAGREHGRTRILMNAGDDPTHWFNVPHVAFAFEQLGLSADSFVRFERPTRINRLIVPHASVEEQHLIYPAFARLTHLIGRAATDAAATSDSTPLYLSKTMLRSGVWRFDNEDAVIDVLMRHGVEIGFPEQQTLPNQIAQFHRRDIICGTVGSSLHTHVFSPKTPRIVAYNRDPLILSNFHLVDAVNDATAEYYCPADGFTVAASVAGFDLTCRLNNPIQVGEDLLRQIDFIQKGTKRMPASTVIQKSTLDEIGIKNGTDKSSFHHNYLKFYSRFFEELRDMPSLKLLEIGIFDGGSLRTWEEYFPDAAIVGVDIDPRTLVNATARVTVEIGDQSNIVDLTRLATMHGPFDIVIDDGSHHWDHQITSFRTLYPFVKPGGFYVMEDIDTSYGTYVEAFQHTGKTPAAKYLHLLLDYLVGDSALDLRNEPDAFIRSYAPCTEFVAFYRRTALIRRKEA